MIMRIRKKSRIAFYTKLVNENITIRCRRPALKVSVYESTLTLSAYILLITRITILRAFKTLF